MSRKTFNKGRTISLGQWVQQLAEIAAGAPRASYPIEAEPERGIWIIQKRLEALGLWPPGEPLDGRPTEATRAAVRRFQRLAGLRVDGDVHDARTRLALRDQVRAAHNAGAIPKTP